MVNIDGVDWTPAQLASAAGGRVLETPPPRGPNADTAKAGVEATSQSRLEGLTIDSRSAAAGSVFVAIRGERDGHDFIPDAVRAGAGAYLKAADHPVVDLDPSFGGAVAIEVADTRAALVDIGAVARGRLGCPVIGITGSVGKTSTKDLTTGALAAALRVWSSPASYNNELGVPLTLANCPEDAQAVVVEMGARGPGHIARLCEIARPTIAVVTAVAAAHTEAFGSLEAIARAKGELVEALGSEGTAVLNADDPAVAAMSSRCSGSVLRYGLGKDGARCADVTAESVSLDQGLRASYMLHSPWGCAEVNLSARGAHQVGNSLAALAVALICGVPLEAAAAGVGAAKVSQWRMDLSRTEAGALVLNDSYNANPASMAAALAGLAGLPARRRFAVLGEMAELGDISADEHSGVRRLAESYGIEVIAVGTELYGASRVMGITEVAGELGRLGEGDAVLIKASRAAGLERVAVDLSLSPLP